VKTLAETLNDLNNPCSCGLEEGRTFFTDSNGDTPKTVGDYTLLNNNNGVRVEHEPGRGFSVAAVGPDDKTHWAVYEDYSWEDLA